MVVLFLTWNQYCFDYYERVAQGKIFGNFLKNFIILEIYTIVTNI